MQPSPDPYSLPDLTTRLASNLPFGRPLYFFESIDSTNSFLRHLPPEANRHGILALTDHQSAGRGKYDRQWSDKPGRSLLFSLLLEANRPTRYHPLVTLGAGVSVCRALGAAGVEGAQIRWPNDVLLEGRKVCGILTETGSRPPFLVAGVGLNVHQSLQDFPPELRNSATSLAAARPPAGGPTTRPLSRADILVAFLEDFAGVFELWTSEQDDQILAQCRRRLSTLGRSVRLTSRDRSAEGVVMDLDEDGSLVLRESTGVVSRWHSATVEESGQMNTMNDKR